MSLFTMLRGAAGKDTIEGQTWLDARHPDYARDYQKWRFATAHYSGDVIDEFCVRDYLIRKATAESEAAFLERSSLADYTPHFATVVDCLAGMLFAVEGDAIRFLGDDERPGLGEPEDETSPMHRLWRDADGQGTGWVTQFKQLAIELIVNHNAWMVVDTDSQDRAIVRLWPAASVVNWWADPATGKLAQVLLKETIDKRMSIKSDTDEIKTRWVLYTPEGFERWEKSKAGTPTRVESVKYERGYVNQSGETILPIFPVQLPLRRHVGWLAAKKANAIFNKESERDHLLRTANFPYLVLVGTDAQFDKYAADIQRGVRALRHDPQYGTTHAFIAPSSESATVATEVLKRKVEEYYITTFREYGDAAREKTATETRQDVASGVGAFLGLLKSAVDEAENQALARVAQLELPNQEPRWFVNRVERSDTFVPTDVQQTIEAMKLRYFAPNTPLPLGPTGLLNIAKQVAQYDGVQIDENEMKAAILTGELQRLQLLFESFPFPAEIRVNMALELLVTLGRIDPKELVTMADGSEKSKLDVIKTEMLDLAASEDEAKKRMAQPLDGFTDPNAPPGGQQENAGSFT